MGGERMERDYYSGGRGGRGGRRGGDQRQQQYGRGGEGGRGPRPQRGPPPQYPPQQMGGGGGSGPQQWGPRPQRGPPPQFGDQRQQQQQHPMGGSGGGGPRPWGPRPQRGPPPQYSEGSGQGQYRSDSGRGRGGAGRGPRQQQPPQRPSQLVPDMQVLRISENLPTPSPPKAAETNLFPVRRPDGGGTLTIKSPRLLVNHFPVKFNSNSTIIHYDVDIKPEVTPVGRSSKIPKSYLPLIKDKLFLDNPSEFSPSFNAYDGEKNIYSAVPLPTGSFKVDFSVAEDMRSSSYVVTIKEVNRLKLSKLKDYLQGNVLVVPRDVLQGMDVVMKENPSRCRISVGRCFFPVDNRREDDLKWGITASKGFQHSLKSTSQGLVTCLDYTVLAFRKRLPVIDFLLEHIVGSRDLSSLRRIDREEIVGALKGLKVNVTHRVTKQKFIVTGITDQSTRNTYFDIDEPEGSRRVSVVDYYRERYGKEIVHQDIPCLDLGKNNRKNYVPMEFCVLVEGQRYPKEQLGKEGERLLKNMSLVRPHIRRDGICEMVQADDGPSGGKVTQNFGLQVVKEMTKVEARVINPPQLKVGGTGVVSVDREKCQWNLVGKSVVEGKSLERWALIDFSSRHRNPKFKLNHGNFIDNLRNRCQNLNIHMEAPLVYRPTDMAPFSNANTLQKLLEGVIREADGKHQKGRLQMIVCVMSAIDPGYKILKWLSETKIGIVTQCCLSGPANEGRDQYLANLAIKINAKLGGSNMELTCNFPTFPGEGHAMFIGADVNHPGAQNSNATSRAREDAPPSMAAVVGSMNWPAANSYAARICPQFGRTEKILNFGSMCKELIEAYARMNKVKPQRIVIFRDGVSEGQFEMVLNEELFDFKKAIYDEHYRPSITVVVAQKRHQTRLFPSSREDGGETGNVPPGTVVDKVITHPFEFDFYLCSHYGGLGTSKPTHYYVLYDDHNFNSDLLQKLIYDLCFTFARCTKPVSLVPPVYYADLVAYRGRMFQEALATMSPGSGTSRTAASSSSSSTALSFDDQAYKLHPELENIMFFV